MTRCTPCAFAPHPPNPLLPHGEKGEFGRPDARNVRWYAGFPKNLPLSDRPISHTGRRGSLGILMPETIASSISVCDAMGEGGVWSS